MTVNLLEQYKKIDEAIQQIDIVRGCLNAISALMGDVSKGKDLDDIQCQISNMEKRLSSAIGLISSAEIF